MVSPGPQGPVDGGRAATGVAPAGAAGPVAPARKPGFADGLGALFGGFSFIARRPAVWPLAAVPVVIALVLAGLLGAAFIALVTGWIDHLFGEPASRAVGVLEWVLKAAAGIVAAIAAVLAGIALAQPLSGPALERIVRQAEREAGAPEWPPTSFATDILRSLQSVAVSFALGVPILAVLFVAEVAFPPAAVVTVPLKLLVTAVVMAWDFCDYPLSIRGVPVGERVAFVKRNALAMLGLGLGLAIVGVFGCTLLAAIPAGVAGAARLVTSIERWEAASRAAPARALPR